MFSWSLKWLWAQCLMVAAGLFLLSAMRVPADGSLTQVSGTVDHVGTRSRKGLGSVYIVDLREADGASAEVLIPRDAVTAAEAQRLIGKHLSARVNWSSQAITLKGASADIDERVAASAQAAGRQLDIMGYVALMLGFGLGVATLVFGLGRQRQ
jgi:hypothetical protein